MSNKVQIIPNKTTSQYVTPYQSNPKFGYIQLLVTMMVSVGGWMRQQTRSCLLRGETAHLTAFVEDSKKTGLLIPGQIVVREYYESEVPEDIKKRFFDKNKDYAAQVAPYVKRTSEDGPELTFDGERILVFREYDPTGLQSDVLAPHNNQEEITAYNATRKAALPAGQEA